MNTTAIQPREITNDAISVILSTAEIAFQSGVTSCKTTAQAKWIMMKGYELGFPITAAPEFVQAIENTVGVTPRGAVALMMAHPEIIKSFETQDIEKDGKFYGCKCTIVRKTLNGETTFIRTFTLDDAKAAGLVKPSSNWEKYPRNMCQWRAIGYCADVACPDILAGMTGILKQGEMADMSSTVYSDDVIDVSPTEPIHAGPTLNDLLEKFGPEKILQKCAGKMPKNAKECQTVWNELSAEESHE